MPRPAVCQLGIPTAAPLDRPTNSGKLYIPRMVYVDEVRKCRPFGPQAWTTSCHLFADTEDELHEFAESMGMRREWFQDHERRERRHYDLPEYRREVALELGASEIRARDWLRQARQTLRPGRD